MVKSQSILSVALACFAALAVGAQPVPPEKPPSRPPGNPPAPAGAPVNVTLSTDKKSYGVKDPIKLTLTAKCPGKTPVKVTFNSGMKYDFEIRKGKSAAGEKVWQWSKGRMFIQMISFGAIDPAKPMVFTETFTPGAQGPDGKPLPQLEPGVYMATGILALSGRAPRPMATCTITVR